MVFALVSVSLLAPWVVRNHLAFDRLVIATATGGANAWLGNHPGATGGQNIVEMRAFVSENRRETTAATLFAASETGWRKVRAFVREQPTEALAIAGRKLALTYGSDGHAARLVRGVGVGRVGYTSEAVRLRLEAIANGFWYVVLALAAVGLTQVVRWPVPARIGVLGVPLTWLAVHLVFLGGPRFHAPETPSLALLAAAGIDRLARRGGRARDTLEGPLHAEGEASFATSREE